MRRDTDAHNCSVPVHKQISVKREGLHPAQKGKLQRVPVYLIGITKRKHGSASSSRSSGSGKILAEVQLVLGVCGLSAANIQPFMDTHGITGMDTLVVMPHIKAKDIVDMYNSRNRTAAHKLGYPTQKCIQGFLW